MRGDLPVACVSLPVVLDADDVGQLVGQDLAHGGQQHLKVVTPLFVGGIRWSHGDFYL